MVTFTAEQRQELAKEHEALPGGGFPIRNRADLKRAIQAFGRAKNPNAAKRWIIRRARELEAEDLLPESWNVVHYRDLEGAVLGLDPQKTSDFLEHYGVLGMRWGVRKDRALASSEHKEAQRLKSKPLESLTNQELKSLNERMNLEANYKRLNPSTIKRGKAIVLGIIGGLGTAVSVYNMVHSPAAKKAIKVGKKVVSRN